MFWPKQQIPRCSGRNSRFHDVLAETADSAMFWPKQQIPRCSGRNGRFHDVVAEIRFQWNKDLTEQLLLASRRRERMICQMMF
jgi:hypothetical protein